MYKNKYITAFIAAAGMGKRMNMDINKQFLTVNGLEILTHTIKKIESSKYIDFILLIIKESDKTYLDKILDKHKMKKPFKIVHGGKERQDSIRNGIIEMPECTDIILTHDGARPFVSCQKIDEAIESVFETGACVLANPVKDTIKVSFNKTTVD